MTNKREETTMQSEREPITREIRKYMNEALIEDETNVDIRIADYILQEKQKSYNQGVIDGQKQLFEKMKFYIDSKESDFNDGFKEAVNYMEEEILKQSAESLGEK